MPDAVAWAVQHASGLVGLPLEQAQSLVREAGLTPRPLAPGTITTLEFRPDRVGLVHDDAGTVTAVRPG